MPTNSLFCHTVNLISLCILMYFMIGRRKVKLTQFSFIYKFIIFSRFKIAFVRLALMLYPMISLLDENLRTVVED